jgi:hypothetical protein
MAKPFGAFFLSVPKITTSYIIGKSPPLIKKFFAANRCNKRFFLQFCRLAKVLVVQSDTTTDSAIVPAVLNQ